MNNRVQWFAITLIAIGLIWSIYMQLSDKGVHLLKYFEGCETVAYQDSVGVWTIGYGHTKGVVEGMTITEREANDMLVVELREYESYVEDMVSVELTQEQFDALTVWVYNLGPTNFRSSTLLRKLNTGDYSSIPTEIKRWNKAGGKVLQGLVKRREAEAAMFEGQQWQS
jgi:GH24 family phage-related lysozyme (muramidase)